jgi:GntR family uxuAB operon transcriptional repressor
MIEREAAVVLRAHDLARLIIDRCSATGAAASSRLPTERQLASELDVTRTAVRNALGLLEAEGRISREVGRGTFLLADDATDVSTMLAPDPGSEHPDDVGPAHVMAARRLIEPRLIPLVVSWATERDFQEMDRCLAGGEGADTSDEFEAWDLALHRAIVLASHNQLVIRMYGAVEIARQGKIWGNLKRRSDSVPRRAARRREHGDLVAALRARDIDAAVLAMEDHLDQVEATLLGRVDATAPEASSL